MNILEDHNAEVSSMLHRACVVLCFDVVEQDLIRNIFRQNYLICTGENFKNHYFTHKPILNIKTSFI